MTELPRPRPQKRGDPDDGLRKLFHDNIGRIHFQAMELGVVGVGVPDTNYCADGVDGWIEMKSTDAHAVELEAGQVGWILRRMRNGGRVFVATRRRHDGGPRKGLACDELWMHEGWDAAQLKAEGLLSCPPILQMEGGPSRWDWDHVRETLVTWQIGRR